MIPVPLLREIVEAHLANDRPESEVKCCVTCGRPARRTACWACGSPLPLKLGRPRLVCESRDCRNLRMRFSRLSAQTLTKDDLAASVARVPRAPRHASA
jgi:hypothetical protein